MPLENHPIRSARSVLGWWVEDRHGSHSIMRKTDSTSNCAESLQDAEHLEGCWVAEMNRASLRDKRKYSNRDLRKQKENASVHKLASLVWMGGRMVAFSGNSW